MIELTWLGSAEASWTPHTTEPRTLEHSALPHDADAAAPWNEKLKLSHAIQDTLAEKTSSFISVIFQQDMYKAGSDASDWKWAAAAYQWECNYLLGNAIEEWTLFVFFKMAFILAKMAASTLSAFACRQVTVTVTGKQTKSATITARVKWGCR